MKDELTYNERREYAKRLYMKEDMSVRDIALEVNANEATVRDWIRTSGWDSMKCSLLTSKRNLLAHYYNQLEKIDQELKTGQNPNIKSMEAYQKYNACIKNLEVELSVSEIIETFELFVQWLRRKDQVLAKKVIVYLDAFLKERLAA